MRNSHKCTNVYLCLSIYIYIYMCVCVCVHASVKKQSLHRQSMNSFSYTYNACGVTVIVRGNEQGNPSSNPEWVQQKNGWMIGWYSTMCFTMFWYRETVHFWRLSITSEKFTAYQLASILSGRSDSFKNFITLFLEMFIFFSFWFLSRTIVIII